MADTDIPKFDKDDQIISFNTFTDFLKTQRGAENVPLTYVVRERIYSPGPKDHQSCYLNKQFDTIDDELEDRYLIAEEKPNDNAPRPEDWLRLERNTKAPFFQGDNLLVYQWLLKWTKGTMGEQYVEMHKNNGRKAWQELRKKYLGGNYVQNLVANCETRLTNNLYSGERTNFNWEKYVSNFNRIFTTLASIPKNEYSGIDETTKVRHLLNNISSEVLQTQLATVRSNPEKYGANFSECVSYLSMFITPKKSKDRDHRVASAESAGRGGGGRGDGGRGGRGKGRGSVRPQMKSGPGLPGKITNRNYTDEDYKKMTQAQRDELRALRQSDISRRAQQAQGGSSGGRRRSRGRDDPSYERHINALVEERVAARVAALGSRGDSRERSRDRDDDARSQSRDSGRRSSRDRDVRSHDDNRTNPATNRHGHDDWGRYRQRS